MNHKIPVAIAVTLIQTTALGFTAISSTPEIKLIEAQGEVTLLRGDAETSIKPGEVLQPGDILIPSSIVRISCPNGAKPILLANVLSGVSNACRLANKPDERLTVIRYRLGGSNPEIPYILSPRMTYLLNERPTFHWNEVPGATGYTVKVLGPAGFVKWEKEKITSTELKYPNDAPSLTQGVQYLLTVITEYGRSSREDDGSGGSLGFEILPENKRKEVLNKVVAINNSNWTDENKALALAEVYSAEDLITDAIKELRQIEGAKTPFVYSRLGKLYAESGLNLLAEDYYSKAIERFDPIEHSYNLAEAQAGLAGVKLILGKQEEAKQLGTQAKAGYEVLGESESAKDLENALTELRKELRKQAENNGQSNPNESVIIITPRNN
ncbi:MAG: tetratricopeptide repeat protein [Coleofasciculus chthonoplastes F3-SA18-01]|uniref:tetratricopeptide repeat protein n=1 Tax=Coleofasciculus chthonoplastes TaxID=64178 RepID=UPI0032F707FF